MKPRSASPTLETSPVRTPPTFADFELATFDAAVTFAVGASRGRGNTTRVVARDLAHAMELTAADERAVLYAAAANGRTIVLDRAQWPAWRERAAFNRLIQGDPLMPTYLLSYTEFAENLAIHTFASAHDAEIYAYERLPGDRTAKIVVDAGSLADRGAYSAGLLVALYNAMGPERVVTKFETREIAERRVFQLLYVKHNQQPLTEVTPPPEVDATPRAASPAAPKKESKVTEATTTTSAGRRGRPSPFAMDHVIHVLAEKNPKREGTTAHGRFALYTPGMTVKEFLDAGGTTQDLSWDSAEGRSYVKVVAAPSSHAKAA